ncbi:hypothetical protein HDV05_008255 [Chytridiales sp. JEL 0842]|nr:hypothetical protein HDV05_008255 [Chytridiales sp. JEL 0842]
MIPPSHGDGPTLADTVNHDPSVPIASPDSKQPDSSKAAATGPASPPPPHIAVQVLRGALFATILFSTSFAINTLQFPSLILYYPSPTLFRTYNRFTQQLFGSVVVLLTFLFCPLELIVTGDIDALRGPAVDSGIGQRYGGRMVRGRRRKDSLLEAFVKDLGVVWMGEPEHRDEWDVWARDGSETRSVSPAKRKQAGKDDDLDDVRDGVLPKGAGVAGDQMSGEDEAPPCYIVMSNHQTLVDWWYIWLLSWSRGAHGDIKIILKESLKWIPILGWGMQFFEFIFLARKWVSDKPRVRRLLERLRVNGAPYWLLIFPEGTVICDNTREINTNHLLSKAGLRTNTESSSITLARETIPSATVEKTIPSNLRIPEHVLSPRSKGLLTCCHMLVHDMDTTKNKSTKPTTPLSIQPLSSVLQKAPFRGAQKLIDLTVGFVNCSKDSFAYDNYLPDKIFLQGRGPKQVYIHIRSFDMSKIPIYEGSHSKGTSHEDVEKVVTDGPTLHKTENEQDAGLRNRKPISKDGGQDFTASPKTTTTPMSLDTLLEVNEPAFQSWLTDRFMEKEDMMRIFYRDGHMGNVAAMDSTLVDAKKKEELERIQKVR